MERAGIMNPPDRGAAHGANEASHPRPRQKADGQAGQNGDRWTVDPGARAFVLNHATCAIEALDERRFDLVKNWTAPGSLEENMDDLLERLPAPLLARTLQLEREAHHWVSQKTVVAGRVRKALVAMRMHWEATTPGPGPDQDSRREAGA